MMAVKAPRTRSIETRLRGRRPRRRLCRSAWSGRAPPRRRRRRRPGSAVSHRLAVRPAAAHERHSLARLLVASCALATTAPARAAPRMTRVTRDLTRKSSVGSSPPSGNRGCTCGGRWRRVGGSRLQADGEQREIAAEDAAGRVERPRSRTLPAQSSALRRAVTSTATVLDLMSRPSRSYISMCSRCRARRRSSGSRGKNDAVASSAFNSSAVCSRSCGTQADPHVTEQARGVAARHVVTADPRPRLRDVAAALLDSRDGGGKIAVARPTGGHVGYVPRRDARRAS